MKKIIASIALMAIFLLFTFPVLAVKPTGTGAVNVPWNLSGDVMPSPPWGLSDIPGSDTASKLIVNQPNGNVEVAVTGVMNGLNPNTTYTVYPSNAWSTHTEWDVTGSYVIDLEYAGVTYPENMVLTQSGTSITGDALWLVSGGSLWDITSGLVTGNTFTFDIAMGSRTAYLSGTINPDGTMQGTWGDYPPYNRTGTWATTNGAANGQEVGDGWPGLFVGQSTFTFMTDELGHGSWHFNLKNADFPGSGIYELSVWINRGGTILVSDNFEVYVD